MKCVICRNGETEPGPATVTLERDPVTLVVKGIPAQVCQDCGEPYIDEATTAHLLSILDEAVRAGIQVEVRQYVAVCEQS